MNALPVFSLFAFIVMLVLLPILFGELMATSLGKLHLSPEMALLLMIAIIVGGLVNIPVKRIAHERVVPMHPLAVFGLGRFWPEMRRETIIAVNFGGCVVPTGLALYQLFRLATAGSSTLFALFVAAALGRGPRRPRSHEWPANGAVPPHLKPTSYARSGGEVSRARHTWKFDQSGNGAAVSSEPAAIYAGDLPSTYDRCRWPETLTGLAVTLPDLEKVC